MPYLLYDEDPYMVIDDEGNLIWGTRCIYNFK